MVKIHVCDHGTWNPMSAPAFHVCGPVGKNAIICRISAKSPKPEKSPFGSAALVVLSRYGRVDAFWAESATHDIAAGTLIVSEAGSQISVFAAATLAEAGDACQQ